MRRSRRVLTKHGYSNNGHLSKLWRHHCRVEVVEEEAFYEGLSASHPDLVEDVGEVILNRVLRDVERRGYLLPRCTAHDQIHYLSLAGAKPVGRRQQGESAEPIP